MPGIAWIRVMTPGTQSSLFQFPCLSVDIFINNIPTVGYMDKAGQSETEGGFIILIITGYKQECLEFNRAKIEDAT